MHKKDTTTNHAKVALNAWAREQNRKSKALYFYLAAGTVLVLGIFLITRGDLLSWLIGGLLMASAYITSLRCNTSQTYLTPNSLPQIATDEMLAWLADWPMDESIKAGIALILERDGRVSTDAIVRLGVEHQERIDREQREKGEGFNKMKEFLPQDQ